MAPGWERVKASFFNWEIFVKTFPGLAQAFLLDIAIFLWCAPVIAAWSLALALMRDVRAPAFYPLKLFAIGYNDLFRGVPVILVAYLLGFGVPGTRTAAALEQPLHLGFAGADPVLFGLCVGDFPFQASSPFMKSQRAACEVPGSFGSGYDAVCRLAASSSAG